MQYSFAQQNRDKKVKHNNGPDDNFAQTDIYADAVTEIVVDKLSSCCASGTIEGFGCLMSLFRIGKISSTSFL